MKNNYLLFVDETKPNINQPYFCFAGIAVERGYYEKSLIPSAKIYKAGTEYENILGIKNILE